MGNQDVFVLTKKEPSYRGLTKGKLYKVYDKVTTQVSGIIAGEIIDDNGEKMFINLNKCSFLNGEPWDVHYV